MSTEAQDYRELIAQADNLDTVKAALVREAVIRETMAASGEAREHVVDMVNAMESMGQEAVLELTDGEPTTLVEALSRYVAVLDGQVTDYDVVDEAGEPVSDYPDIVAQLHAILTFPYPGEEALIQLHRQSNYDVMELVVHEHPDGDRDQVVVIGGQTIARLDWERAGSGGVTMAEEVARAVHRAVLARVIPDRPHQVQLTSSDRRSLLAWLERPEGTWTSDSPSRFSITSFQGTGLIVRTWPYRWLPAPAGLTSPVVTLQSER